MAAGAAPKEARRQLLWAARCPQGQPAACHSLTGSEGPAVTTRWQPSLCFGKRRGRRLDHHLHGCRGCLEGGKTSAPLGGSMSTGAASCLSLADWKRGPCRDHQVAAIAVLWKAEREATGPPPSWLQGLPQRRQDVCSWGGVMSTGAASCLSLADWKRGPCRDHQLAAIGTI